MKVVSKPTENQSDRIHGDNAVRLIACHTPEGSYSGTVKYVTVPPNGVKWMPGDRRVSYHQLINHDGTEAAQFVPFHRKAWHAGAMNSLTDGIAVAGWASQFDLESPAVKEMAKVVARRLHARGLKPQWTTDPVKGGFCRHADLQADRNDPTPDIGEWKLFVLMVQNEYDNLAQPVPSRPWPIPIPKWFWEWMIWLNRNKQGPRPSDAPRLIPAWAWRRRIAWLRAQKS